MGILVPAGQALDRDERITVLARQLREAVYQAGGAVTAKSGHAYLLDAGVMREQDRNVIRWRAGLDVKQTTDGWVWKVGQPVAGN